MTAISVTAFPTSGTAPKPGWRIEADGFTADLWACRCDPSRKGFKNTLPCAEGYHRIHVQKFVDRLARLFSPRADVPTVPDVTGQ